MKLYTPEGRGLFSTPWENPFLMKNILLLLLEGAGQMANVKNGKSSYTHPHKLWYSNPSKNIINIYLCHSFKAM